MLRCLYIHNAMQRTHTLLTLATQSLLSGLSASSWSRSWVAESASTSGAPSLLFERSRSLSGFSRSASLYFGGAEAAAGSSSPSCRKREQLFLQPLVAKGGMSKESRAARIVEAGGCSSCSWECCWESASKEHQQQAYMPTEVGC